MGLIDELADLGFPLLQMPADKTQSKRFLPRCTVEVLPKLTQTLLTPKNRVQSRPDRSLDKYYGQIDNWLFPHLFVSGKSSEGMQVDGKPVAGQDLNEMIQLLGETIEVHSSVLEEAERINKVSSKPKRHEMVGAFVSGFQGALGIAGQAKLVGKSGGAEGYYMLPVKWHSEWQNEWKNTARKNDTVYSVPVEPYRGRKPLEKRN